MTGQAQTVSPTAVTQVVKRVRQTRDFRPDPVPEDALRDILDVARWTGSVGNRQPWTFVTVTDPEVRRRMAELAPYTPHVASAPVVIVAVTERRSPDTDNFDEGRLAERMMIAAAAHGLHSGLARAREDAQRPIAELLGVPDDLLVRTMVSVGYPTEAGAKPKTAPGEARRPLDELVRAERYA